MGQKIHPIRLRLGITRFFRTHWYVKSPFYRTFVQEDHFIRKLLEALPARYIISKVELERRGTNLRVNIFTSQVEYFLVIENGKSLRERLKKTVTQVTQRRKYGYRSLQEETQIQIFIHQVSYPDEDATCLACFIVIALEQRVPFRRALGNVEERVKSLKRVQGFRLQVSGRLNGSEIARIEWIRRGQVSLHKLSSNLDYSYKVARTTYGSIGVKVWLRVVL